MPGIAHALLAPMAKNTHNPITEAVINARVTPIIDFTFIEDIFSCGLERLMIQL